MIEFEAALDYTASFNSDKSSERNPSHGCTRIFTDQNDWSCGNLCRNKWWLSTSDAIL